MVAIRTTSLLFTSVALLASYVNAYGQIAQVVDAKNFCVFLPPNDSVDRNISDAEWEAQAFCIGNAPQATNAGTLASGFIQSAHYLSTDQYVQITGQINPSTAKLNVTDEGGQMDIKAPKGSSCVGWKYYVNLIEPAGNTYCIRCCNDDRTCNRGISSKGCAHVIPGDYSGPNASAGSSNSNTAAATTTTSTKNNSSTTKSASADKGAATDKVTTTKKGTNATTTTAPIATTTTTTAAAADAAGATSTTTEAASNANTTPIAPAANSSSSSSSSSDAASSSSSSTSSSSSPSVANQMLSQNEQVSGQSVSGADKFQPSIIALTISLIVMAMMNQ